MEKNPRFRMSAALVPLLAASGISAQVTLLEDHFDDGALDPAWSTTLADASGWTFSESGSTLTVTDIAATTINGDTSAIWATVSLERAIVPTRDFTLEFDFSWSAGISAMQGVRVQLLDATDTVVIEAGFNDGWVMHNGQLFECVPGSCNTPGLNTQPMNASRSLEIVRAGEEVTSSYDGTVASTLINSDVIDSVRIRFRHFAYIGAAGASSFGTLSVDRIAMSTGLTSDGAGCAGTAGIPTISSAAPLTSGEPFRISLWNAPPPALPGVDNAVLFVGIADEAPVPLDLIQMVGCQLWIYNLLIAQVPLLADGTGTLDLLTMPPGFEGQTFYFQWIVVDPLANPRGLTTSDRGSSTVVAP